MTGHVATFLEWTTLDFGVVLFGIQQYISVSRDLKRDKEREAEAARCAVLDTGHSERQ
ncbi:MAG: hypothetical protein POG74_05380 [Acidocella sp.]|nr:hypothetical protein [Acidocella sp.]